MRFGVGIGVVVILSRWLSGSSIAASPSLLIKYGLIGVTGWALMISLALAVFGYVGKKIRREHPEAKSMVNYLQYKLHPFGYRLLITLIAIASVNLLMLHLMAAGVFVKVVFGAPLLLGMGLALLFAIIYSWFTTNSTIHRLATLQMVLIFGVAIFIPLYFFVRNGAENVYSGIYLYHPYLLVLNNIDGLFFVAAGVVLGFGQVFTDRATWQRLYFIDEKKLLPAFLLSSFVWFTLFLAFVSLVLIVIHKGGFQNSYSLFFDLYNLMDQAFIYLLFMVAIILAVLTSLSAELYAMISLFNTNHHNGRTRGWVTSILLSVFAIFMNEILRPSMSDLFFFFSILYASLIIPIVVIFLYKGKISNWVVISAVAGLISGYGYWNRFEELNVIWVSLAASGGATLFAMLHQEIVLRGFRRKERTSR